jgi:hypothetical protein
LGARQLLVLGTGTLGLASSSSGLDSRPLSAVLIHQREGNLSQALNFIIRRRQRIDSGVTRFREQS